MPVAWNQKALFKSDEATFGSYYRFTAGFGVVEQNLTGEDLFASINGGVIALPGQNGHVYLEISKDGIIWVSAAYHACRNNQAAGTGGTAPVGGGAGHIASGGQLMTIIPKNWFFRLSVLAPSGFAAATFALENGIYWLFPLRNLLET